MQRFKRNDAVFILPKYAHLYPASSAAVISAELNPFRPIFNAYTLAFADGSNDTLFEFQIIEDVFDYTTLIASLTFDSRAHSPAHRGRGPSSDRHIILQAPGFDLDMKFQATRSSVSTMGQVLERGTKNLLKNVDVRLMKESMQIATTMSDSLGIFKFSNLSLGALNILVVVPQHSLRILGGFWI